MNTVKVPSTSLHSKNSFLIIKIAAVWIFILSVTYILGGLPEKFSHSVTLNDNLDLIPFWIEHYFLFLIGTLVISYAWFRDVYVKNNILVNLINILSTVVFGFLLFVVTVVIVQFIAFGLNLG